MKLVDLSVREFVYQVDSASPAPGGGSVSSLAASLGAGLLRMVGHLTIPKKKFSKLDEVIQQDFIANHESLKALENRLIELIDRDTEAFNAIMDGFKMPKETESEKKKRKKAIEIPETIAEIAYQGLQKADFVRQYGNKNALSDVGVSVLMLFAGLEGAVLNVKINLSGVSDDAFVASTTKKIDAMVEEAKTLKDTLLEAIHNDL